MAFPNKHLYNDEQIVIDRHPHWWYLAPRGAVLLVVVVIALVTLTYDAGGQNDVPNWLLWLVAVGVLGALVAFVIRFVGWRTTNFVVTTERCIYRSGVLTKSGIEIPLDRISTVYFEQTLFERMLKAGDLGIESAGEGSRQDFSDIYDPIQVQNTIYQQMEGNENRKYDRIGDEAREAALGVMGPGASAPAAALSVPEQIEKLEDLLRRGVITREQFESQKDQLLR